MALLLSNDALRARGLIATRELAPLAAGLLAELQPILDRDPDVPREKALLSRDGGRCPTHGVYLDFDPFAPHRHRCPICGEVYTGELHDRFWLYWYQLWLAERSLHGALLGNLLGSASAADLSARILERYADQYVRYPNRDNVLGPTRLFFSTYLESIWLLNISIATDLLEVLSPRFAGLGARVRERIIEPSAALIAEYDEGASNRQVWNDAALIAANRLLGREAVVEQAAFGRSGVTFHLERGLLTDGTWYEGENYHLFAHRGLWYCLTMLEAAGVSLPAPLVARFQAGFVTPFLTSLPDMTLPSRRDSQYAISLRQPRFAELCELGLAREEGGGDRRLRSMLYRLYHDAVPRGETGRSRSTADVERNLPATALTRADLGWRSLLFARQELPSLEPAPLGSVLLDAQGIAVFRREDERIYVALDYGASGGGHGHPDRLNLLLSEESTRWLDDMGTGSYVDPSLHWYRSTLAHNAPMFNGRDQERVDGELIAYDECDGVGWISARARDLFPGTTTTRTLVVTTGYVLDELSWEAEDAEVVLDLPIHIAPAQITTRVSIVNGTPRPSLELYPVRDSLGVLEDISAQWLGMSEITAQDGEHALRGFVVSSAPGVLYQLTGPGAPGVGRRRFLIARVVPAAKRGWLRSVWDWSGRLTGVRVDDGSIAVEGHSGLDTHRRTGDGWHIERSTPARHVSITLDGSVRQPALGSPVDQSVSPVFAELRLGREQQFHLGAQNYRRSEEPWEEAGRPTATVTLRAARDELVVGILVRKSGALTFVPSAATNPYDNESADINGDGLQFYFVDGSGATGLVLVPEGHDAVRARPIDGWPASRSLHATWRRRDDGYGVQVHLAFDSGLPREFALGVVVNEKPPDRERRRGQLVLGGSSGEFVYLRGDREDRERLPRFRVID